MTEIDNTTDPQDNTKKKKGAGRPLRFNWPAMKVGDIITVPNYNHGTLLSAALQYAKRHSLPWKFTASKKPNGDAEVRRIL